MIEFLITVLGCTAIGFFIAMGVTLGISCGTRYLSPHVTLVHKANSKNIKVGLAPDDMNEIVDQVSRQSMIMAEQYADNMEIVRKENQRLRDQVNRQTLTIAELNVELGRVESELERMKDANQESL